MDPQTLWQQVSSELLFGLEEPAPLLKNWFSQTKGETLSENALSVSCQDSYLKDLVFRRYKNQIEEILLRILQRKTRLEIQVIPVKLEPKKSGPLFDQLPESSITPVSLAQPNNSVSSSNFNPNFNFENFVVGSSNRIAFAAAQTVAESPGSVYNPLVFYGGTGVGKTHLLQAIGSEILRRSPLMKLRYFTSERFVNDLIEAIRFKKDMREFRGVYRNLDILLMDDIQFLGGGKESSQEEFFHTFNELQFQKKQLVFVSDRKPSEIENLTDRLVSRLSGGLTIQIGAPDFETRLAIIQTKGNLLGLPLSLEVASFIAESPAGNVREIEGILLKIKSAILDHNKPINLSLIQELLLDKRAMVKRKKLTPEVILNLIGENFETSIKDLCGKRRQREVVLPRQIAMFLLRNDIGLTLTEIGAVLGGRDHSTVLHGIEKIERGVKNNNQFLRSSLRTIREELFEE